MERLSRYGILAARVMISMVFLLNSFGVIDQNIPAREMMERGAPSALVPVMMLAGRSVELVAGMALILGIFPRLAAVALFAFLVPATLVSHSFWLSAGTPAFMGQLVNFSKNFAILGGLLFVASTQSQPALSRSIFAKVRNGAVLTTARQSHP
jgi:putative oxidoreductase